MPILQTLTKCFLECRLIMYEKHDPLFFNSIVDDCVRSGHNLKLTDKPDASSKMVDKSLHYLFFYHSGRLFCYTCSNKELCVHIFSGNMACHRSNKTLDNKIHTLIPLPGIKLATFSSYFYNENPKTQNYHSLRSNSHRKK